MLINMQCIFQGTKSLKHLISSTPAIYQQLVSKGYDSTFKQAAPRIIIKMTGPALSLLSGKKPKYGNGEMVLCSLHKIYGGRKVTV